IRVYPNPVRDIIKIEFDLMGLYEISLYGFNGQLIKQIDSIQISSGSKVFTIERNTIHEGSYILRILNKNSGEIHHIKLILL
ncbi:MAG: T9SS type A sorting domain-containing protein, partial [Sphingobacteriales bacterium]